MNWLNSFVEALTPAMMLGIVAGFLLLVAVAFFWEEIGGFLARKKVSETLEPPEDDSALHFRRIFGGEDEPDTQPLWEKVAKLKVHRWCLLILAFLSISLSIFFYLKMWKWVTIIPLYMFLVKRAYIVAKAEAVVMAEEDEGEDKMKILLLIWQDFCKLSWRTVIYITWFSMWYFNKSFLP